jgi:hypothetical protein
MDREVTKRWFKEFTTDVDLANVSGIEVSEKLDKEIEKILKPLIEEGKAFKRVRVNRSTGVRSTSYAYNAHKKVQEAIDNIFKELPADLGFSDGDVPFDISGVRRRYYNETKERILDPRTLASIRADALRAGGSSTTDKASGFTTTLVPAGLAGATSDMHALVDRSDAKYLQGRLPSSALADGASPATVEERAQARVARKDLLKSAEQQAISDYIRANPTSPLAIEQAQKFQNVTNREERARILQAERTPGTPEFQAKIATNLERIVATEQMQLEWARKNKNHPLAKAIIRKHRSKTAGGRLLNRAAGLARTTLIATIIGVISAGVKAMVNFLALLPSVAANVHKLSMAGSRYNITEESLYDFIKVNKKILGNEAGEGVARGFLESVYVQLASVVNGNIEGAVKPFAAVSGAVGGKAINTMARYHVGDAFIGDVIRDTIDDSAKAVFGKWSITKGMGGAASIEDSFARVVRHLEDTFGGDAGKSFVGLYEKWKGLDQTTQDDIASKVTQGKGSFIDLLIPHLGDLSEIDVSSFIDYEQAKNVIAIGRELKEDALSVRDGVLIKIAARLEPILEILRQMLVALLEMANKATGGLFTETLKYFYDQAAVNNDRSREIIEERLPSAKRAASAMDVAMGFGDLKPEERSRILEEFNRTGIPVRGKSWEEMSDWAEVQNHVAYLLEKRNILGSEDAREGKIRVTEVSDEAFAMREQAARQRSSYKYKQYENVFYEKYGNLSPEELEAAYQSIAGDYVGRSRIDHNNLTVGELLRYLKEDPLFILKDGWYNATNSFHGYSSERRNQALTEADLVALKALEDEMSMISYFEEGFKNAGGTPLKASRFENAALPRQLTEKAAVDRELKRRVDSIVNDVGNQLVQNYINSGGDNVEIDLKLTVDKQEYEIVVKDDRGNKLGSVKGQTNAYFRNVDSFSQRVNIHPYLNSYRPQSKYPERGSPADLHSGK